MLCFISLFLRKAGKRNSIYNRPCCYNRNVIRHLVGTTDILSILYCLYLLPLFYQEKLGCSQICLYCLAKSYGHCHAKHGSLPTKTFSSLLLTPGSLEWPSGLRDCISVQEASQQIPRSNAGCITSGRDRESHRVASDFGRGRQAL
jgi:hypothetical protein